MTVGPVAIVGAGRVGRTLARALVRLDRPVTVLTRIAQPLPSLDTATVTDWAPALAAADLVVIAVSDDAIADVAKALVRTGAIGARHVVLHSSGLKDRSALAALDATGAALGSLHILQTFRSPEGEPDLLAGSPGVVEGDSRAIEAARAFAGMLKLTPIVTIAASEKPRYHAAAVFASNYLVVLVDVAARLGALAGVSDGTGALFLPLLRGTISHLGTGDPAAAQTGPIRRGDAGTVARHLSVLSEADRALYLALAEAALRLAEREGLASAAVEAIAQVLATGR
ncbi:MAG TPA: Rossmann-like and DUF2520 domain-containing protein [Gemmatimonadales bacterium]|nr:Rossmann-like and DUF2520 domain-containing protein [Gemmatimonadales bacterium]